MTAKEAIKSFEPIVDHEAYADHFQDACKLAIQALEKQIPKKCKVIDCECFTGYMFSEYFCANCESMLARKDEYGWFAGKLSMNCPNCGQAIDWGKEEE